MSILTDLNSLNTNICIFNEFDQKPTVEITVKLSKIEMCNLLRAGIGPTPLKPQEINFAHRVTKSVSIRSFTF